MNCSINFSRLCRSSVTCLSAEADAVCLTLAVFAMVHCHSRSFGHGNSKSPALQGAMSSLKGSHLATHSQSAHARGSIPTLALTSDTDWGEPRRMSADTLTWNILKFQSRPDGCGSARTQAWRSGWDSNPRRKVLLSSLKFRGRRSSPKRDPNDSMGVRARITAHYRALSAHRRRPLALWNWIVGPACSIIVFSFSNCPRNIGAISSNIGYPSTLWEISTRIGTKSSLACGVSLARWPRSNVPCRPTHRAVKRCIS